MDSQQKTAVVTGSSSGIGRAISQDLLSHGYKVIGLARDHKKFDPKNKRYFPYEIDLTDFDRTVSLLKRILVNHEEINVLVSNAGLGKFQSLENFSIKQIQSFLDLNLLSHLLVCQFLVKHFRASGGPNFRYTTILCFFPNVFRRRVSKEFSRASTTTTKAGISKPKSWKTTIQRRKRRNNVPKNVLFAIRTLTRNQF